MVCSHCPTQRPIKNSLYIDLCGGVYTTKRQTPTEIPIGFCVNLSVSVSVSMMSGTANVPFIRNSFVIILVQQSARSVTQKCLLAKRAVNSIVSLSVTSKSYLQTTWFLTCQFDNWNFRKNSTFSHLCQPVWNFVSWLTFSEIMKKLLKLSMQLFIMRYKYNRKNNLGELIFFIQAS